MDGFKAEQLGIGAPRVHSIFAAPDIDDLCAQAGQHLGIEDSAEEEISVAVHPFAQRVCIAQQLIGDEWFMHVLIAPFGWTRTAAPCAATFSEGPSGTACTAPRIGSGSA